MNTNSNSSLIIKRSRKNSLLAGIFYILTFVSVPTLVMYGPIKGPNYLLSSSSDITAIIGGLLEIVVALSGIATAVILFPVLKKQNESLSLALVAARILESGTIFVGVAFILTVAALHQMGLGEKGLDTSRVLVLLYDRIFLLGQSFMPAICDLLLGFLLLNSRLVPKGLAMIGIAGGPILLLGYLAVMFGLVGQHDALVGISAIPVALFEFTLGWWLIFKGFDNTALLDLEDRSKIQL